MEKSLLNEPDFTSNLGWISVLQAQFWKNMEKLKCGRAGHMLEH